MRSFQEFVQQQQIEPLILEISFGLVVCGLDPEGWILDWVRKNDPLLEAELLNKYSLLMEQGEAGPFPGQGGFFSGVKNWWNSLRGGLGQGWKTAMQTPTQNALSTGIQAGKQAFQAGRAGQTERAFQDAFRYVNGLVQIMQNDPRLANNQGANNALQRLTKMRGDLTNLGREIGGMLRGGQQPQQPQPQPPQQPQPGAPQSGPQSQQPVPAALAQAAPFTGRPAAAAGAPATAPSAGSVPFSSQPMSAPASREVGTSDVDWLLRQAEKNWMNGQTNPDALTDDEIEAMERGAEVGLSGEDWKRLNAKKASPGNGTGTIDAGVNGPTDVQSTGVHPGGPAMAGTTRARTPSPNGPTDAASTMDQPSGAAVANTGVPNVPGSQYDTNLQGPTSRYSTGFPSGSPYQASTLDDPYGVNQADTGLGAGPGGMSPVDTGYGSPDTFSADTSEYPGDVQKRNRPDRRSTSRGKTAQDVIRGGDRPLRFKHGLQG